MAYGDLKVNNLIYDTGSGDASRSVVSIPLSASPTFTGVVTVPTPAAGDNTTKAATTAFVQTELGDYAALAGATFTGTINGTSLVLSADLTVNGTTTTINTSVLDVEDINITLGKVASPTDTTANNGGFTLKGTTDKTFNWLNATDSWTSSENIEVAAGKFFKDDKGKLRSIPVNPQSSNATYVATTSDAGKSIEATGTTQTVELSGNTGFSAGDAVTIINGDSSTLNITATNSLSLRNTADASTGNRALAQYGMATVYFTSSTVAYISGAGLS